MAAINFAGLATGIDSTSLIQSILERQRAVRVKPLSDQVAKITDRNNALNDLSDLLDKLKTTVSKFRAVNGGSIVKSTTSSNETVASVDTSNAASNSSFTLDVTQIAKNGTQSYNSSFASATTAIAPGLVDTGNNMLTITIGTGAEQETTAIEVTNTTTLNDIVSQFNDSSSKGVATVVNTGTAGSPSYKLVVSSLESGTEDGQLSVSAGNDITNAGIFTTSTLSQATDAQFSISGIDGVITRSSNKVSDVVTGLTLNLEKIGSTTITTGADTEATKAIFEDFVKAFNEVASFVKENNLITRIEDGEDVTNEFGPLADTSLDNQMMSLLRQALPSSSYSAGGVVKSMADLGITTNQDGTLKFDEDTFSEALSAEPNSVAEISSTLGEKLGAVDGLIANYTRFNGIIDVSVNSGQSSISKLNDKISLIEKALAKQEQSLVSQFAKLESLVGKLQSQQSSLSSILGA
jgi:flagellar hook-associated protein 2